METKGFGVEILQSEQAFGVKILLCTGFFEQLGLKIGKKELALVLILMKGDDAMVKADSMDFDWIHRDFGEEMCRCEFKF